MTDGPKWDDALPILGDEAWNVATIHQKEFAIREATQIINRLSFKGRPATATQSLSWPRVGVFRSDGVAVVGVPDEIKEATSLLAKLLLAQGALTAEGLAHVLALISHLLED